MCLCIEEKRTTKPKTEKKVYRLRLVRWMNIRKERTKKIHSQSHNRTTPAPATTNKNKKISLMNCFMISSGVIAHSRNQIFVNCSLLIYVMFFFGFSADFFCFGWFVGYFWPESIGRSILSLCTHFFPLQLTQSQ